MQLKSRDKRFFLLCDNAAEREKALTSGFEWDNHNCLWFTDDICKALSMKEHADPVTAMKLEKPEWVYKQSFETGYDGLPVPVPNGLQYRDYQKAGIHWCADSDRRVSLLADEMGLGKSIQAIGVANLLMLDRILIVCPAVMKYVWAQEIRKWYLGRHCQSRFIVSGSKNYIPIRSNVVIVNYDLLHNKNIYRQLMALKFDLGIFDEAHYLKNPKAKRTIAALAPACIAGTCDRIIVMTGTPVVNRPIDLYPLLAWQSPETIAPYTDYFDYARKFCGAFKGTFGWYMNGASHKEELNFRLRSTLMIRRLKKDVLTELPEKTLQIIPMEIDDNTGYMKLENEAFGLDKAKRMNLSEFVETREYDPDSNKVAGRIAALRREMGLKKVDACIKYIKDAMEETDKIVVFAHHRAVIEKMEKSLSDYKPVTITGSTPPKERAVLVHKFQNDPECRVFIGNIQAAGTGITLTAASTVIFVESSWVPGEIDQAVDRCHRIGQKDAVLAQFLVVRDSLDEYMIRTVVDKKKNINVILN